MRQPYSSNNLYNFLQILIGGKGGIDQFKKYRSEFSADGEYINDCLGTSALIKAGILNRREGNNNFVLS